MAREALERLDVPAYQILAVASSLRHERHEDAGRLPERARSIEQMTRQLEFAWLTIAADSPLGGRTIGELQVRTRFGASIVGVMRNGSVRANPDADVRLLAGDQVAVLGNRDQIARFSDAAAPR
jgi:CPA2 family monovalent cation:H+ antiporter-2